MEDGIRMKCQEERIPLERNRKKRAGFCLRETSQAWRLEVGFFLKYLFVLFLAVQGLGSWAGFCLVAVSGGYSSCMWAQQLWLLGSKAHRPSSLGTWAQLPCSMWHLPRPGTEPTSPALAGGFFTTESLWKP